MPIIYDTPSSSDFLNEQTPDPNDHYLNPPQQDASDEFLDETLDEAEELSDVELRLEEANCYKALLRNSLFNNASPIAQKVENKVRDYIRKQLRVLLGLESEVAAKAAQSVFSDEEVVRLRALAQKILDKERQSQGVPTVTPAVATPAPMSVNRAQVEPLPTPEPQPQKRGPKPQARKAPAPGPRQKQIERTVTLPDGTTKNVKIQVKEQASIDTGPKRKQSREEQEMAMAGLAQQQVNAGSNSSNLMTNLAAGISSGAIKMPETNNSEE